MRHWEAEQVGMTEDTQGHLTPVYAFSPDQVQEAILCLRERFAEVGFNIHPPLVPFYVKFDIQRDSGRPYIEVGP